MNKKNKFKFNNFYYISIVCLILFIILFIIYNYLFSKVDIQDINIIQNNNNTTSKVYESNDYNIFYYGIKSLDIYSENKKYDFITLLKSKKIDINLLNDYLNSINNNKIYLYDGGTIIYNSDEYEIIFCNTLEGNKDIYIGINGMRENIDYCGQSESDLCYFSRTYYVVDINESDDEEFFNVKLYDDKNYFNAKINKTVDLEIDEYYVFRFGTLFEFVDTNENIFNYSYIIDVNKLNGEKVNEPIRVNKDGMCLINE